MISLVLTSVSFSNTKDYQLFSSIDVTVDLHDPLCDNAAKLPTGSHNAVCDAMKCTRYTTNATTGTGCIKQWATNTSLDSYISLKRCASGQPVPEIVKPNCAADAQNYLMCPTGGAMFVKLNTFALPPYLVQQACDQDSRCQGYSVMKDQSSGSTLSYYSAGDSSYFAVPSSKK